MVMFFYAGPQMFFPSLKIYESLCHLYANRSYFNIILL